MLTLELYETKKTVAAIIPVPWLDALSAKEYGTRGVPLSPEDAKKAAKGIRHRVVIDTEPLGSGYFLVQDAGPSPKNRGRQQYIRITDGQITDLWEDFIQFVSARCQREVPNLPLLTGTPAQVAWAGRIRAEALLRIMDCNDRAIEFPTDSAGDLRYLTSAHWWIENREEVVSEAMALIAHRRAKISSFLLKTLPELAGTGGNLSYAKQRRLTVLGALAKTKANTPELVRIVEITTAMAIAKLRDVRWWIDTPGKSAYETINASRQAIYRDLFVETMPEEWKPTLDGGFELLSEFEEPIVFAKDPNKNYHLLFAAAAI
jgi:hypothetical protein